MKTILLGLAIALMVALHAATASAGVNCDQVRRYLKTGRSPEDIAESMVIDVSEVKKCQEQEKGAKDAPTPAAKKDQQ